MQSFQRNAGTLFLGAVLAAAVFLMAGKHPSANANVLEGPSGGAPHYTVVETQGFNLLVTDNAANKLYYYATDKDTPIGSPMKLRASIDLSQIGKDEVALTKHNLENIRTKDAK